MQQRAKITVRGIQTAENEPPETTELVTFGTFSTENGTVCLRYEETELTGLEGTTTEFCVTGDEVTLTRTGNLRTQMHFSQGQESRTLYDLGFGALLLSVRTERVRSEWNERGGVLELFYRVRIEEQTAGTIDCRIEVEVV